MSAPLVFVLSSVASGSGVYTGTFPGGASDGYVGMWVVFAGFANPLNNGTFKITASSATTITTGNTSSVSETIAATATDFTKYTCLDPGGMPSAVVTTAIATGRVGSSRFSVLCRPAGGPRNLWLEMNNVVGVFTAFSVSLLQSFDAGLTWQILQSGIDLYNSPAQQVNPSPSPGALLMVQVDVFTDGTSADVVASSN